MRQRCTGRLQPPLAPPPPPPAAAPSPPLAGPLLLQQGAHLCTRLAALKSAPKPYSRQFCQYSVSLFFFSTHSVYTAATADSSALTTPYT